MDLQAFTTAHDDEWHELRALTRTRRLTSEQSDRLVLLYQVVSTHLSVLRSTAPDPVLVQDLSLLLSDARAKIAGAQDNSWRGIATLLGESVPAALYRARWWSHAVTFACVAVAVIIGVWVATTPEGLAALGSEAERDQYVNEAFESYYDPSAGFATMVWANNAWIAAQCVAFGITGAWPAIVLVINAVNVGMVGGLMASYGELGLFLQLIAPHGLLELTAIFVAGGAGLKLFWSLVAPGRRPRTVAVAEEGRSLMLVALGLVGALALSGVIEGFVTGSTMVWWLKIVIGAIALALFWAYVYVLGGRAVRAGKTGDLDEQEAGFRQQYA